MKTVYRISDNGYVKPKIPGATKLLCLENFLETFGKIDYLIADNCSNETIKKISTMAEQFHVTKLGNAPSFIYSIDILAKENIENDELIYFVEDDYLHHLSSKKILKNAIDLADYLTLFDHPDKYSKFYNYGEISKIQRVKNQHWKTSVSTTMTFACKYKTIKDDCKIFKKFCVGFHPNDHEIFECLQKNYKRKLMVCIPGLSFHTDITTYIMNVDSLAENMDSWAVDYIIEKMKFLIFKTNDEDLVKELEEMIKTKNRDYSSSNNLSYLENLSMIYEKKKLK